MTERMSIRHFHDGDQELIVSVNGGNGWNSSRTLWDRYVEEQASGERIVLLAVLENRVIGYGSLVFRSQYLSFERAGIPEINNVVVAQAFRRCGVGSSLIAAFELRARELGFETIGIGVGLYSDYGPAQRLYIRLGFIPDGNGVTFDHRSVSGGEKLSIDDDLVLWMTKPLCSD